MAGKKKKDMDIDFLDLLGIFKKRSKRSRAMDLVFQAKVPKSPLTWMRHPNRYDWPGIDMGKKKRTVHKKMEKRKVESEMDRYWNNMRDIREISIRQKYMFPRSDEWKDELIGIAMEVLKLPNQYHVEGWHRRDKYLMANIIRITDPYAYFEGMGGYTSTRFKIRVKPWWKKIPVKETIFVCPKCGKRIPREIAGEMWFASGYIACPRCNVLAEEKTITRQKWAIVGMSIHIIKDNRVKKVRIRFSNQ